MGTLWIAGLGPGKTDNITVKTLEVMKQADLLILRTQKHPAAEGLVAMGIPYVSCDHFYEQGGSFAEIYESIADYVMAEATGGKDVCYCVPGHPRIAEDTVVQLLRKADDMLAQKGTDLQSQSVEVIVLPAVSFLDAAYVLLGIDPVQEKLTILDAASLHDGSRLGILPLPHSACLFAQVYHPLIAGELKLALLEEAPSDAEVLVLHHIGIDDEERLILCPLAELDHFKEFDHLSSVYLPLNRSDGRSNRLGGDADAPIVLSHYPLDPLVEVFQRLLAPDGCPWDREQTHTSLKPYLLEEAQEVLAAIDENDMDHLKEELGDVLMQVVFHSALAKMGSAFDMNDVICGVTEKLIRRHPHVFGEAQADNAEEVEALWKKIKEEEREA